MAGRCSCGRRLDCQKPGETQGRRALLRPHVLRFHFRFSRNATTRFPHQPSRGVQITSCAAPAGTPHEQDTLYIQPSSSPGIICCVVRGKEIAVAHVPSLYRLHLQLPPQNLHNPHGNSDLQPDSPLQLRKIISGHLYRMFLQPRLLLGQTPLQIFVRGDD
jgi:hypothetical protein